MKPSKEFLEKMATFNYYQFTDIPKHYFDDKYFNERFEDSKSYHNSLNLIPEEVLNSKVAEVALFAEVREQTRDEKHELYYIDHSYIVLFNPKTKVIMQLKEHRGKYHFYPIYSVVNKMHMGLNYEQIRINQEKLLEPNKIGKFTDKKLIDWFFYIDLLIKAWAKTKEEITSKKDENQKIIDDFITSLGDKCKVYNHDNYYSIDTKNFSVVFELLNNGEYLSKKISFKGTLEDIAKLVNVS